MHALFKFLMFSHNVRGETHCKLIGNIIQGPITAVKLVNNVLLTSGKDRMLNVWKNGYYMDKLLNIPIPTENGHARTILYHSGQRYCLYTGDNNAATTAITNTNVISSAKKNHGTLATVKAAINNFAMFAAATSSSTVHYYGYYHYLCYYPVVTNTIC